MNKVVDSVVRDLVEKAKTPSVQSFVQSSIFTPLISILFDAAYPYIVGVLCLWILMLVLLVAIVVLLLRRKGGIQ